MFLILAFCFSDCKKYPEGGKHYGAKSRIKGTWELKQLFINGTATVNTNSDQYILSWGITSGSYYSTGTARGSFDFESSKKYVTFSRDDGYTGGNICCYQMGW